MKPLEFDFKEIEKMYNFAKYVVFSVSGGKLSNLPISAIQPHDVEYLAGHLGKKFGFNIKNSYQGGIAWGILVTSGLFDVSPNEFEGSNINPDAYQAASELTRKMIIGDIRSFEDAAELFGLV